MLDIEAKKSTKYFGHFTWFAQVCSASFCLCLNLIMQLNKNFSALLHSCLCGKYRF